MRARHRAVAALLACSTPGARTAPTVSAISSTACTSATDSDIELLFCTPGSSGAVLTIQGSNFWTADPALNVISFTGGSGDSPVCYPLWTDLQENYLLCNFFTFSGDTTGNWSMSVTANGVSSTATTPTLMVLPATPVISALTCTTLCESGDTLTVTGRFFPTDTASCAFTFSGTDTTGVGLPSCTASAASNTSVLCVLSVPPGGTGHFSIVVWNTHDSSVVSATSYMTVRNKAPVISLVSASFCRYSTRTDAAPASAILSNCDPGGGILTITGENFHPTKPWVHDITLYPNTEARGSVSVGSTIEISYTNDSAHPAPLCPIENSTSTELTCALEVRVGGPFWLKVTVGGLSEVARIYVNHEAPTVASVSGSSCTSNSTTGEYMRCPTGATLTVTGNNFVAEPYHGWNDALVEASDAASQGHPLCWVKAATRHYLSCLLEVPDGTQGSGWQVLVAVSGKRSDPASQPGLALEGRQASITDVYGDYCVTAQGTLVCEAATEGDGTPERLVTFHGRGFSPSLERNRVMFTGGDPGHNGQALQCLGRQVFVYTKSAAVLVCSLVAPAGASGQWSARLLVGSTFSFPCWTPLVIARSPVNNVTVSLPLGSVFLYETFDITLTTLINAYPADPMIGTTVNVSLRWWDGTPPPNGAQLERLGQSADAAGAAALEAAFIRTGVGTHQGRQFRVLQPGAYQIVVDVFQPTVLLPQVRGWEPLTVIARNGSVPSLQRLEGCSTHPSPLEALGCRHGSELVIIGANLDTSARVVFNPSDAECTGQLWALSIPPDRLVCRLAVSSPMWRPLAVSVRTAQGQTEAAIAKVYRDWELPPALHNVSSAELHDGDTLALSGARFAPSLVRNTVSFAPAGPTDGEIPRCVPTHASAASDVLECRISCTAQTWGPWRVVVSSPVGSSTENVQVRCYASPVRRPVVTAVSGRRCVHAGGELRCDHIGAELNFAGRNFEADPGRMLVTVHALYGAKGPVPGGHGGVCRATASRTRKDNFTCSFTASPQTYGRWQIRLATTAGSTTVPEVLRIVYNPAVATDAQPRIAYVDGCQGTATLTTGVARTLCEHGQPLRLAGALYPWDPAAVSVSLAFHSAASSEAEAAGLLPGAPGGAPTCEVTEVEPASVLRLFYQTVHCTLNVPNDTAGIFAVTVGNGLLAAAAGLFEPRRTAAPSLLSVSAAGGCVRGDGGVLRCTNPETDTLVLHCGVVSDPSGYQVIFAGGTGAAPNCTSLEGGSGEIPLVCAVQCDATTAGVWSVAVARVVGALRISSARAGAVVCHRSPAGQLTVSSAGGCTGPSGRCVDGDVLVLRGAHFDTDSVAHVAGFSAVPPWAEGRSPRCTPAGGGNATLLRCALAVPAGTSGPWGLLLARTGDALQDTGVTLSLYSPPTAPPNVLGVSPRVVAATQASSITVMGAGFDANAAGNAVIITPTTTGRGPPPSCEVTAASPTHIECTLTGAEAATVGEWAVSVTTVQGPSPSSGLIDFGSLPTAQPTAAPSPPQAPSAAPVFPPTGTPFAAATAGPQAAEDTMTYITVTLLGALADFSADAFRAAVAAIAETSSHLVVIIDVAEASVIVVFAFSGSPGDSASLASAFLAKVRGGHQLVSQHLPGLLSASEGRATAAPSAGVATPRPPPPSVSPTETPAAPKSTAQRWRRLEIVIPAAVFAAALLALLCCRFRRRCKRKERKRTEQEPMTVYESPAAGSADSRSAPGGAETRGRSGSLRSGRLSAASGEALLLGGSREVDSPLDADQAEPRAASVPSQPLLVAETQTQVSQEQDVWPVELPPALPAVAHRDSGPLQAPPGAELQPSEARTLPAAPPGDAQQHAPATPADGGGASPHLSGEHEAHPPGVDSESGDSDGEDIVWDSPPRQPRAAAQPGAGTPPAPEEGIAADAAAAEPLPELLPPPALSGPAAPPPGSPQTPEAAQIEAPQAEGPRGGLCPHAEQRIRHNNAAPSPPGVLELSPAPSPPGSEPCGQPASAGRDSATPPYEPPHEQLPAAPMSDSPLNRSPAITLAPSQMTVGEWEHQDAPLKRAGSSSLLRRMELNAEAWMDDMLAAAAADDADSEEEAGGHSREPQAANPLAPKQRQSRQPPHRTPPDRRIADSAEPMRPTIVSNTSEELVMDSRRRGRPHGTAASR